MIKSFYVDSLLKLGQKMNELGLVKENIIQVVYTGKESLEWVVIYDNRQ